MKPPPSSVRSIRVLCGAWVLAGIALAIFAFAGPRQNQREISGIESIAAAREALAQAAAANDPATRDELLALAADQATRGTGMLGDADPRSHAVLAAATTRALVALESGNAFDALTTLLVLAQQDRPAPDSPWTESTPMIESAIAEARYKIALMCRDEGDGHESWSKYAEAAARSFHELAQRATTPEEKDAHLANLAVCTRLIHGGDEYDHSQGFPARRTIDCRIIARSWQPPPPNGGGGGGGGKSNPDDKPWDQPPPEPDSNTKGR